MRLGVCYYPEHWPEAWWPEDAREMVQLGIRQVRIGEFCWSRVEPAPGKFDWGWLDRAVQVLADAGLQIVMCTPTATPPKWMVDLDPDMLAVGADGRPRRFGSRRHYDFSSNRYLAQAERITRAFAERYGTHPAVVAWQTDNEFGCHDSVVSHSEQAVRRFRSWLAQRYGTVAELNKAWGTVFWSQEYGRFDEVDSPAGTVTEANPAHLLDFQRFASDEVVRFNRAQCDILRRLSPGRQLVHNFMQLFTAFDHHRVAQDLDVASWDSYPIGALEMFWFSETEKQRWLRTGHPDFTAFHHDLYRGMSRQPFWVMEQQPGPVNWARWNPAPAAGMVRLWTWEAFAHGADVVSYFRWRQAPFGQEQMHAGLQTPDRKIDQGGLEAKDVAEELLRLTPHLEQPTRAAPVALIFDYQSLWALETQPQGVDYNGLQLAFECYSALRSLALDVDIVPSNADLSAYRLVALPAMPLVTPALQAQLLASKAQVVLYPRTGSKLECFQIPQDLPPGPLQRLIDIRVTRVESLRPGADETASLQGKLYRCHRWRETLSLGSGVLPQALFADGTPAIARQGRVRYLAGWFSTELQRIVLECAAADAGIATERLPDAVRVRRRGDLLMAFNYGSKAHKLVVPGANWLLGCSRLPAQGVAIARKA